ncbi:hypothetical protein F4861DRAFT_41488 [Xylaria intraflava]|nr:hypothetical protein F4861DRAFT_41488 [Xylaria intraflava]
MEPRNGRRHRASGSIRSPPDHRHDNPSEVESSDESDDDIPATLNRRSNATPTKRPSVVSLAHPHTSPLKRSLSDAARGGIVLYPGSKKPRNGYNMPSAPPGSLPFSSPSSSRPTRAPARSPSRSSYFTDNSPSLDTEDDVRQGLVSNMNNVFNHSKTRQAEDSIRQRLQREEDLNAPPLNGVEPAEQTHGEDMDQDSDSPLAIPLPATSDVPLSKPDGVSGKEVNEEMQATYGGTKPAEDKEGRGAMSPLQTQLECVVGVKKDAEIGMQAQVDVPVRNTSDDVWNIPQSPSEPGQQEMLRNATQSSNQKPQPIKKGRLSSVSKGGLQKKPISSIRAEGAELPEEPSLVPNETDSVQIGTAKESVRVSQDDDARAPADVSGMIQNQMSNTRRRSNSILSTSNHSQIVEKSNLRDKTARVKDAARPVNHTMPTIRDSRPEEVPRVLKHDKDSAAREYINEHRSNSPTATVDDEILSDFINGFDTEMEDSDDTYQSAEESFVRDAANFNARQNSYGGNGEVVEGPSDNDVTAIHLDHQPLQQLCKLLSDSSWAAVESNWQWQHFDYDGAQTEPARALLPLLAKLERLYQATPEAPNLKEQARFLRKHANMLRYYFDKIEMVVEHIGSQRLEIPKRNDTAQNVDPRKRKRMARDLVLYVIPMAVHVLASAWNLGGKTWFKTSFTSGVVELLQRALDWIMALHHCLSRELKLCPLEDKPEGFFQQKFWQNRNARREAIGPLLDDLGGVISAAPDGLAKAKVRANTELKRGKERLGREGRRNREQKVAQKADVASAAVRKKRPLTSRDIHRRPKSPTASFRPSPSLTTKSTVWSIEEQKVLFRHIQKSYPVCPDLNHVRWELNRSLTETAAMAENILGKMLATVLKDWSAEERAEKVRKIMRTSSP